MSKKYFTQRNTSFFRASANKFEIIVQHFSFFGNVSKISAYITEF